MPFHVLAVVCFLVAKVIGFSNIASEGTAFQSDVAHGGFPWRAIDGNKDGLWKGNSVTHTYSKGEKAWWRLTFAAEYIIEEIRVWNRVDADGLRGATVWVGPKYVGTVKAAGNFFRFPKISAVASEITIKGSSATSHIMIAEVEVFGECYRWSNIAYKGTASQSTTLSHNVLPIAELAIDGNIDGIFTHRSVSHTTSTGAWW